MLNRNIICYIFAVSLLSAAQTCQAREKNLPLIVKSEYFSVYGDKDVDLHSLLEKMNFNYLLKVESLTFDSGLNDVRGMLAKTLDALYLEVSDILGINIYSFHGNLKIFSNKSEVLDSFKEYLSDEGFQEASFYLHDKNTIYISYPDITLGMLGHEMAHAIISHYFVVPPPAKVQEVLSGYVDYNLRKSTGTLP